MSLIKCPECNKQISNKATICPNCGFPIANDTSHHYCEINCQIYDLDDEVCLVKNGKHEEAFWSLKDKCDISANNCLSIIKYIKLTDGVPSVYNIEEYTNKEEKNAYDIVLNMDKNILQSNIPKCPTCGSTNIQKISTTKKAMGSLFVGLLSTDARNQFECNNCGYKW